MMDRQNYKRHFDMLELTIEATHAEVKTAYLLLKEICSGDSLAIMSMVEEISAEQTEDILQQIEDSYRALTELFNEEKNVVSEYVDKLVADIKEFNGPTLKEIRQKLNISLDDMAMATRVQRRHLVNIEDDNFGELPVAVYTRGFVINYAAFISLDPELVAESYMKNFRKYHEKSAK